MERDYKKHEVILYEIISMIIDNRIVDIPRAHYTLEEFDNYFRVTICRNEFKFAHIIEKSFVKNGHTINKRLIEDYVNEIVQKFIREEQKTKRVDIIKCSEEFKKRFLRRCQIRNHPNICIYYCVDYKNREVCYDIFRAGCTVQEKVSFEDLCSLNNITYSNIIDKFISDFLKTEWHERFTNTSGSCNCLEKDLAKHRLNSFYGLSLSKPFYDEFVYNDTDLGLFKSNRHVQDFETQVLGKFEKNENLSCNCIIRNAEIDKALRAALREASDKLKEKEERAYNMTCIKEVIYNNPATIVLWADGTKTVVKVKDNEKYDKEKGLAMAMVKKALGNKGNYYDIFKKWNANKSEETLPETPTECFERLVNDGAISGIVKDDRSEDLKVLYFLSTKQYASRKKLSDSTIGRKCLNGEIKGVLKGPNGYQIPWTLKDDKEFFGRRFK